MFGKFKDFLNFAKYEIDDALNSTLPEEFKEDSNENHDDESQSSESLNPAKKRKVSPLIANNNLSPDLSEHSSVSKKVVRKTRSRGLQKSASNSISADNDNHNRTTRFKRGPKTVAKTRVQSSAPTPASRGMGLTKRQTRSQKAQDLDKLSAIKPPREAGYRPKVQPLERSSAGVGAELCTQERETSGIGSKIAPEMPQVGSNSAPGASQVASSTQVTKLKELDQGLMLKDGVVSDTKKRKRKSSRNGINRKDVDVDIDIIDEEDNENEKFIGESDKDHYYKELQKTIAELENKKIQIKKLNLKIKLGVDEKKKLESENKNLEKELAKIRQELSNEQNEIKIQLANVNKDFENQKKELDLKTNECLDIKKKYQKLQDDREKEIQKLNVTLEKNRYDNKKFHDLEKKHKDLSKNSKLKELEQQTTIEALTRSSEELRIELKDKMDEIETLKNTILSLEEKIVTVPPKMSNDADVNKDGEHLYRSEDGSIPEIQKEDMKKKIIIKNIKNKNEEKICDEDDDVESTDFGHISTDNDEFPFSQKNQKLLKVLRFNNVDMEFIDIFPDGLEEFHNFMKIFEQTMNSKKNKTKPEFYSFKDTLKLIIFPKEYDMAELRKTVKRPFEAMCLQLCKSYVESGLSKKFLDQESMVIDGAVEPDNDTKSAREMSLEKDKKTEKATKNKNNGKERKFIRPIAIFASLTLIYQKNIENMKKYSSHVDMLNNLNLKIESMIFKKDYF